MYIGGDFCAGNTQELSRLSKPNKVSSQKLFPFGTQVRGSHCTVSKASIG